MMQVRWSLETAQGKRKSTSTDYVHPANRTAKVRKAKGPKAEAHGGPKKPRSAFCVFCDEKRPAVMEELRKEPGFKVSAVLTQ